MRYKQKHKKQSFGASLCVFSLAGLLLISSGSESAIKNIEAKAIETTALECIKNAFEVHESRKIDLLFAYAEAQKSLMEIRKNDIVSTLSFTTTSLRESALQHIEERFETDLQVEKETYTTRLAQADDTYNIAVETCKQRF